MSSASRTVYGRTFQTTPPWIWLAQRISGILLGPLVALHIFLPGIGRNPILSGLLLCIILVHGFIGIRRLVSRRPLAGTSLLAAVLWTSAVLVFGLIGIVYAT